MSEVSVLEFDKVSKAYEGVHGSVPVLGSISFNVPSGDTVAIVGPSGSGKSTLLAIAAGLEAPSSGKVVLCDERISELSEDQRTNVRRSNTGFIFQSFELIDSLTALENVLIPLELEKKANAEALAEAMLERVGLSHRLTHLPAELSGGEKQRVALARAFVNKPRVLFADEPTGNLDRRNSEEVIELLFGLNEQEKTTLLIATHDLELAARCSSQIDFLSGGDSPSITRNVV